MKIAGEFLSDCEIRRLTQVAASTQSYRNSASLRLRNNCQNSFRRKRDDLCGRVANEHGTTGRIAGIKTITIDHDLAAWYAVSRINA
jgi:hypothetical protein